MSNHFPSTADRCMDSSAKCKIVSKSQLNNSGTLNSSTDPARCSQMLPDRLSAKRWAPRCSKTTSLVLWNNVTGAPQFCASCGTEYKNILKIVWVSLKCYNIKLLECTNFGAIGNIGRISKTVPVHHEHGVMLSGRAIASIGHVSKTIAVRHTPGAVLSRSDYYSVDIK